MPRTAESSGPCDRDNAPIASSVAPIQCAGSCSDQPGKPAIPPGEIAPGAHIDCFGDGSVMPVQLIDAAGPGGGPRVATLNLTSFSWGANTYKSTVQILVGL